MKIDKSLEGEKKIVFINQDSGYLMIDIVNTYANAGYLCTLITGRIIERSNPLNRSVKVERIIRYNRNSVIKRLFTWIWASVQILFKLKFRYRKEKLFIVSNPPVAPLLPLLVKNRYSILIFDIYPDALVNSDVLSERNIIIRSWGKANTRVYKKADRLFTITEGMQKVLQNYSGNKKVELVPIWSDNKYLKHIEPANNPFIKKYNPDNKFAVVYSGNIGLTGQVDSMLNIASEMGRDDIIFIFIGEGARKKWLKQKVDELKLRNVLLLPWQPVNELACSLSSANLAVVGIDEKASRLAMPSKLLSYLSVGAPILCLAQADTDLAKFVVTHKVGRAFDSSQKGEIKDFIEELIANPGECIEISKCSLAAAEVFTIANTQKFL